MTTATMQIPVLPDPDAYASMVRQSLPHEVRGSVAAITGETIEVKGMTAPLGAICQLNFDRQSYAPSTAPEHHAGPGVGAGSLAKVVGFRGVRPLLAPLETLGAIAAGDPVRLLDTSLKVRVGDSLCGRVLDAFGNPIDGKPLPDDLIPIDTDRQPPSSLERPPIDTPMQTGVRAIDGMLTCGLGQRLGIFAGSGVGKSTLLGMLARNSAADRIVIGMVGERGREVQDFITRCLGPAGLARSVVVVATSDRVATQRVAAAWTATAVAESFRDAGHNVLLLLDSVTRFAMAGRELGLAAGEPPTTRGYPPSVFNSLPRLVERAGRTTAGSITAFYTVLVEGDDNNEPIADALRGLLDGHIVLNRALTEEAHYPPIDVLQSLSRLQPELLDAKTLQAVSGVRRLMAEYRKNADLISIGAYKQGADPKVDAAIARRDPIRSFLIQQAQDATPLKTTTQMLMKLAAGT
ncbi:MULTISPECIES: FliI/YscN family ATPase [Crateriforma]|uniref:Putative ATP synthase YscN n=1 Tax=Crateriforma conspicua TaxID=2527996 RepID=A0A5C6FTF5_9PLAN|nr:MULTISPECIES: FliI/YscN family ATPase [Crateriforma]TWU64788.1 putative ATP synthase YscN [Crateriforma conspicua]